MTDTSKIPNLNPHFGVVIGFVDAQGQLQEGPSETQYSLLINVGEADEVKTGERVLVFGLGPQMTDPNDGRDLGCFEIVRGEGKVKSAQIRMAVIISTETRQQYRAKASNALAALAGTYPASEWVTISAPFKNPQLGDRVRFI